MAGDRETGVSIMRMEEGLDTGPVCLAEGVAIGADETADELHDRLADLGARLMVEALAALEQGSLECREQGAGATYASKIEASETRIDWSRPASELHNQIRGLSPHPGAWFEVEPTASASASRFCAQPSPKGREPPECSLTIGSPSPAARAPCA